MTTIEQRTFSNEFSWLKIIVFSFKFHGSESPIENESALVQVMAWRLTGAKPLPEPMLPKIINNIRMSQGHIEIFVTSEIFHQPFNIYAYILYTQN